MTAGACLVSLVASAGCFQWRTTRRRKQSAWELQFQSKLYVLLLYGFYGERMFLCIWRIIFLVHFSCYTTSSIGFVYQPWYAGGGYRDKQLPLCIQILTVWWSKPATFWSREVKPSWNWHEAKHMIITQHTSLQRIALHNRLLFSWWMHSQCTVSTAETIFNSAHSNNRYSFTVTKTCVQFMNDIYSINGVHSSLYRCLLTANMHNIKPQHTLITSLIHNVCTDSHNLRNTHQLWFPTIHRNSTRM